VFNRKYFVYQSSCRNAVFLLIAVLITAMVSSNAYARMVFSGANLFASESKQLIGYEAISGPIQYIEDADGSEGYSATNIKRLTGRYERKVYDFPESYSAEQLFTRMSTDLNKDGYEIVFSCIQQMCGEVPGWKLYLGKSAEGTESNQYYLLAKSKGSGQNNHTLAVYINEFSNQPRVIFDTITEPPLQPALPGSESFAADTVYFYSNSHYLSSDQKQRLHAISKNYQEGQWEVVGFSDNTGSPDYNFALSKRRATEVVNQLVNVEKFSATNFTIIPKGDAEPATNNADEASRALNRRVTIRRAEKPDNLMSDISN
jgi:outer membrane protein OmpA-like peptidoglycan-associated protein